MKQATAFAALLALAPLSAEATCMTALALALDISSSVNAQEYEIQKGGLALALLDPAVRKATLSPPGSVALLAYEWSGWQQQDVIANWTLIESEADLDAFAARINTHTRNYAEFSTAIGKALLYGASLFEQLPWQCSRHIIDISGDGVNNEDVLPNAPRVGERLGLITVNALVIEGAVPPPAPHYRDDVIRGPGAFMMVARNGFEDYPDLIKGKLIEELRQVVFIGEAPHRTDTR